MYDSDPESSRRNLGICWNACTAKNNIYLKKYTACIIACPTPVFETISCFRSESWQFFWNAWLLNGLCGTSGFNFWWIILPLGLVALGWRLRCWFRKKENKQKTSCLDCWWILCSLVEVVEAQQVLLHIVRELLMDAIFGFGISTRPHTWTCGCILLGFVWCLWCCGNSLLVCRSPPM